MPDGLDLIILDDNVQVAQLMGRMAQKFYTWGEIHVFTDPLEARTFCFNHGGSLAIFVVDVFLGETTAFDFLESVHVHFPMAMEDSIVVTGQASEDVVNMCLAADVTHLLEKPIKLFSFQLAVMSIANKYVRFAARLMREPQLMEKVQRLEANTIK
jgi:response regulator of citrate/malate metabolism